MVWNFIQNQLLGMKCFMALIERLHMEDQIADFIRNTNAAELPEIEITFRDKQ